MIQANVHANRSSCLPLNCWLLRQFEHKTNVPALVDLLDHDMLDPGFLGDRAVVADAHFSHILYIETPAAQFIHAQFATVTVDVFQTFEPATPFKARKTRPLACLDSSEESAKGFVQAAQHLLQAGRIEPADCVRAELA